jgi:hypothetical protein
MKQSDPGICLEKIESLRMREHDDLLILRRLPYNVR